MLFDKIEWMNEMNVWSVLFRLVLALVLGGMLGYEREQKHRPAGLRTYVLVCLGATLACITNIYMCEHFTGNDPARIPAQVISGMGFLGAGTIIVTRNQRIKGLTTAAGLWCCAAIGIAIGSGFYLGAIITTVLIAVALKVFLYIDRIVDRKSNRIELYVEYTSNNFIRELIRFSKKNQYKVSNLQVLSGAEDSIHIATFTMRINDVKKKSTICEDIENMESCIVANEL